MRNNGGYHAQAKDALQAQLDSKIVELGQANVQILDLEKRLEETKEHLGKLQVDLGQETSNLNDVRTKCEQLSDRIQISTTAEYAMSQELISACTQADVASEKLEALTAEHKEAQAELVDLRAELRHTRAADEKLTKLTVKSGDDQKSLSEEVVKLQVALDLQTQETDTLEAGLSEAINALVCPRPNLISHSVLSFIRVSPSFLTRRS